MKNKTLITTVTYGALGIIGALTFVLPRHLSPDYAVADPPVTEIDEIIMYGVDADTNALVRYSFKTEEYKTIGTITDQDGDTVVDVESLAYIPDGPHKGLYTSPQDGTYAHHLVKVSFLDASATGFAGAITSNDVVGMIACKDGVTGEWGILATTTSNKLLKIDLDTGAGAELATLDEGFEGLAVGADGTMYGAVESDLWRIDPSTWSCTRLGSHPFARVESLEYAFGDDDPKIIVPGVPDAWTADGIMFGYSDDDNEMLIFNPVDGDAVAWDCPIDTPDLEGIVFVTVRSDPVYRILYRPFD